MIGFLAKIWNIQSIISRLEHVAIDCRCVEYNLY